MKTTIVRKSDWTSALSLPRGVLLVFVALFCIGHVPALKAVSPPPDGGYANANTAEGTDALFSLTSGVWNVAVGFEALYHDTIGNQNTATGYRALFSNKTGDKSTAYGSQSLYSNLTGNDNVANGFSSLYTNTTGNRNTGNGYRTLLFNNGDDNTAVGWNALFNNRTGNGNTATGSGALLHGSGGSNNTATGFNALFANDASDNTAVGAFALNFNTSGESNTATGDGALFLNTTGNSNTATGFGALESFTTGSNNTANGVYALGGFSDPLNPPNGSNNTAMGASALIGALGGPGELDNNTAVGAETLPLDEGGHDNIAIGYQAGANLHFGDNNIEIGNAGDPNPDSNTIRIGDVQIRAFIAGIYGTTTGSSTTLPVIVDSNGQLGTAASSERFKKEIKPMDSASEAIMGLRPVTFHYKSDTKNALQFGLIAEQVAKVNPDLVVRDTQGEIYTVRYDAVNAMLLNEFLKEHRKVEELQASLTKLMEHLKEQDSKIEKISSELEMTRPGSHVVANR